jgi:non-specific serine/threonine protein kinase
LATNTPSERRRGWRQALSRWLTGPEPSADSGPAAAPATSPDAHPSRIGHYAIVRKLGEGGMGVVYAARDEKLERTVALKLLSTSPSDGDTARLRFWREARAAASVNHPNVCHIHEIGEDHGTLFIAMELLEGESLADRLRQGPLHVTDAVSIVQGMLAALAALHDRGLVHRDVKPSNVFLTPHGVKLLDFGLARHDAAALPTAAIDLTLPGTAIGTPRYMAPEQLNEGEVDARADLFAAGAVLFEMLAGRPAFGGRTVIDVLHATLHEQPPALTGSPAIAAVDRVIRRALAKVPDQRFMSAKEMAEELLELPTGPEETRAMARALTRVVVLPFRVLRADPEIDFLAYSLPDAIATSLSGVGSLVVRSSAVAARFAGDAPDLKVLAADADVDRVVMGTLLRAGDQVRATAQLVEAPSGTLLTAQTINATLGDLFALQDDIARRVVDALALPLTGDAPSPSPDAPRNPRAYELYLRANQLARSYSSLHDARQLYLAALELDPQFALAWAHLGRAHRVIGKYVEGTPDSEQKAEEALQRALAINPRLSVAHKFYAALEADIGEAQRATVRLLHEAERRRNDPELFAGLVHTLRYAGLYDEAIAAHAEARRLDPNVATSLQQTVLMTDDVDRLVNLESVTGGADEGITVMGLGFAGRFEEARRLLSTIREAVKVPTFHVWWQFLDAWLDRRPADMLRQISLIEAVKIQFDPEAMFLEGWMLCEVGALEEGLAYVQQGVSRGYLAAPTMARSRHFDRLRDDARFRALQAEAEAGRARALAAFREAGGERLLGRQPVRAA